MRNDLNDDFICDGDEGTCLDIRGQFLSQSGGLLGSEFVINDHPGNQFVSPVVFGASKFMVVWTSGDEMNGAFGDVFGATVSVSIFVDGFESGDVSAWSSSVP